MLEIRFFNLYFKKRWMILFFIFIYQLVTIIVFIITDQNSQYGGRWIVYNLKNFDIILLGVFVFPIIVRYLNENEFYKNHLLKTQNYFKSNLIIIVYFLLLIFTFVLVKKVIFYSIDYFSLKQSNLDFLAINFELSFFGDLYLVIASLLIGKVISILPIKKHNIFYVILFLISFSIILFIVISFPVYLWQLTPNQSTDIFSTQSLNAIFTIKNITMWTPIIASFIIYQIAYKGYSFDNFLNYNNILESKDLMPIDYFNALTIWIIISFFVYIGLIILLSYLNKSKIIKLKNKINFQNFQK